MYRYTTLPSLRTSSRPIVALRLSSLRNASEYALWMTFQTTFQRLHGRTSTSFGSGEGTSHGSVAFQTRNTQSAEADRDKQIEGSDSSIPVDYEPMFHAAFTKRLNAGIPHLMSKAPKPQKTTALSTGLDHSGISPSGSKSKDDTSEISTISCVVFADCPTAWIMTLNGVYREFTHDRIEPQESTICDFDDSVTADRMPGPSRIPFRQVKAAVRTATDLGKREFRDDPLAPFYAEARARKAEEVGRRCIFLPRVCSRISPLVTGPGPASQ